MYLIGLLAGGISFSVYQFLSSHSYSQMSATCTCSLYIGQFYSRDHDSIAIVCYQSPHTHAILPPGSNTVLIENTAYDP